MNSLEANTRNTKSKGDIRSLRLKGIVPGIIYGGSEENSKVSISKLLGKTPQLAVCTLQRPTHGLEAGSATT